MKEPPVAIVLLNYNSYDYTRACVESLKNDGYSNYLIIIVDNASPDGSSGKLARLESEKIHVIQSEKNGGFAFGNNLGINYAMEHNYSYVLLLNNDTLVTEGFLSTLVAAALQHNGDISTCRIMYNSDRDKIWYAGGEIDWFGQRAIHTGMNSSNVTKNEVRKVSFISGCCMLLSKQCIDMIGGLPEEYFMYYEDLDYCQNAIKNGLKLIYVSDALIFHCVSASGGGSSSPFVVEWMNRSRRRFMSKYGSCLKQPKRCISIFFCELKAIISALKSENIIKSICAYMRSFS